MKSKFFLPVFLAFYSLLFLSLPSQSIEDCQLIKKILSNLGSSMSRNRLVIAAGGDQTIVDEASRDLSTNTKLYRNAKREYDNAHCNGWRRQ